mmetsp:Transcript_65197/g.187451  ORF Transcript_65197/g.187451 Transcript_65197/m.187451 type:complete len:214 (+) Transcript_65197:382-1023(+)
MWRERRTHQAQLGVGEAKKCRPDRDRRVAAHNEAHAIAYSGTIGQTDRELREHRPSLPQFALQQPSTINFAIREGSAIQCLLSFRLKLLTLSITGLDIEPVAVTLRIPPSAQHLALAREHHDANVRSRMQRHNSIAKACDDAFGQGVVVVWSVEGHMGDARAQLHLHVRVPPILQGARRRVPAEVSLGLRHPRPRCLLGRRTPSTDPNPPCLA